MTRDEARAWYANVLLDKIRQDRFPSQTHMTMVEEALAATPELIPDYMEVLLEKVSDEQFPSITMLQRIQAVAEQLPR
jgi:hypothetical protein